MYLILENIKDGLNKCCFKKTFQGTSVCELLYADDRVTEARRSNVAERMLRTTEEEMKIVDGKMVPEKLTNKR